MNTPDSTQHTPTPWKLTRGAANIGIEFDDGVSTVRHVAWARNDNEHQEKDARFIVTACNAWHDPAALRARLAELEGKK